MKILLRAACCPTENRARKFVAYGTGWKDEIEVMLG
jgi:hypothetical protein